MKDDDATSTFEAHRDRLEELAYRMTGRVSVAQDLVQDAYLRWQQTDHEAIRAPASYLTTIVTHLCLDELKSARAERETYPGPWLPEPRVEAPGPEEHAAQAEAVSTALLAVLETLSPVQRAVFLLREVFDYDYETVSDIVGKRAAHCRKIAQRAREHIAVGKPRYEASPEEQARLVEQFMNATQSGDPDGLAQALADDAILYSDGGEVAYAAKRPIYGADRIRRFMLAIQGNAPDDLSVRPARVGGGPGVVVYAGERPQSAWSFSVAGGKIQRVYVVVNPDKLRHLEARNPSPPSSLGAG